MYGSRKALDALIRRSPLIPRINVPLSGVICGSGALQEKKPCRLSYLRFICSIIDLVKCKELDVIELSNTYCNPLTAKLSKELERSILAHIFIPFPQNPHT